MGGGRDGAPSPSAVYDAFDEAIAAANAVSDALCEWNEAVAAADRRGGTSSSSAAAAA